MKSYAEEHNIMAQPRCSLIGSMKEEKFLLATPLPKWYLEHGLVVTRIHQVVEFTPELLEMLCLTPGELVTLILGKPSLHLP